MQPGELSEVRMIVTSLQTQYDFLQRRVGQQEDAQRDLVKLVKLLQSYNLEQDEENRRNRDRNGECDHFLRLMEERLIA